MAMTEGFAAFKSLAEKKVKELSDTLVNPKLNPKDMVLADVIDQRGQIKGINFLLGIVNNALEKQKEPEK